MKFKLYVLCLLCINSLQASSDSLSQVLSQYEEALKDLIGVYEDIKPPKPIQLDKTDIVGSTFQKIIQPYIVKITGYSNVVMSGFSRKFPYVKDLQALYDTFQASQKEVERISVYFPKDMQKAVVLSFYKQLSNSMVQICARIVQHISYALNTDADDLEAAKLAYELAWAAQTPDMKIIGFANVKTFREQMTSFMINLYQAALKKQNENLEQASDKEKVFEAIVSYYEIMAQVYTNAGNDQQASAEKQNAILAKGKMQKAQKADDIYQQAEKQAEVARSAIIIDFFNPEDTRKNVLASTKELGEVLDLYKQAQAIYQEEESTAEVARCQAKQMEVIADQQMRTVQLLWIMFLTNQGRSGPVKAYDTLHAFYQGDPTKGTMQLDKIIQALTNLEALCATKPNQFSTAGSLQFLIQQSIQFYHSADINHVHAHNPDRLANSAMLHDIQNCISSFVIMLKGMIQFASETYGGLSAVDPLLLQAKKIDELFEKNSDLKDFFVYFPDFEQTIIHNKSFTSFLIQYIYRVLFIKAISLLQDTSVNREARMLQALAYMMDLQSYKKNLTDEQWNSIQEYTKKIAQSVDLQKVAASHYEQAKRSQDWTNKAQGRVIYQSSSDMLWNRALYLYEVLVQVFPTIELKKQYVQVLNEYVLAYLQNVSPYIGYRLYIANNAYKVYEGASDLNDTSLENSAQQTLNQLFEGRDSFFSEVHGWIDQAKSQQGSKKELIEVQQNIKQVVTVFDTMVAQQEASMQRFILVFHLSHTPRRLLISSEDQGVKTLRVQYAENDFSVQIETEDKQKIAQLEKEIDNLYAQAESEEKDQNFVNAAKIYKQLETLYLNILKLIQTDFEKQSYHQKYFLVKTRATACFLAASVVSTGSETLGKMVNIPDQYYAVQYTKPSIDMQSLASTIPSKLQGLTKLQPLNPEQKTEALAIFKAYVINEMLSQKGVQFSDCYVNYLLNRKRTISKENESIVEVIEQQVTKYMDLFKDSKVSAEVVGQSITIEIDMMPIPAIEPLYPTATYAGVYFIGAETLFKPGTKLLTVAGASYVPGQDEESAQVLLQELAYAYLSEARKKLSEAEVALQKTVSFVEQENKKGEKLNMEQFASLYNASKQLWIRAQALLFATGSSAYAYMQQAKNSEMAEEVKQVFINSYKQQSELLPKLLVGNPFSQMYMTVLSDLNQMYVSWTAELNPATDSALIAENQTAIIKLYVESGNSIMNYNYASTLVPQIEEYHYVGAAKDYLSARKQYVAMNDVSNAEQLNEKAMKAYFLACAQNIKLYFAAKKDGIVYTPVEVIGMGSKSKTKPTHMSYAQLQQAYQDFQNAIYVNAGKTNAYTEVKRLLLDAAMFYEYLAQEYSKKVDAAKKEQAPETPAEQAKPVQLNPKVLAYLQEKGLVSSGESAIDYVKSTTRQKVFSVATDLYVKYIDDSAVLANWCNILNMTVAYQYIEDYLGGLKSGDPHEFTQKWQTFFQAVQKESSSFQNPASAYVG